ncbi:MAG TPA: flagellar motor protein MotB [Bacteroidota bacterium]|jgi:chemotaxis protein MotB|nr:flagellar motor protein MotB [Bacteroidota bacterium]
MQLKKKHTEQENTDRWLLTYADLITLLLGLFVILYGMSKIDIERYEQVAAALGGVFGRGEGGGVMEGKKQPIDALTPLQRERNRIQQEIQNAVGGLTNKGLVSLTQNERGVTVHLTEELLFPSGSAELKRSSLAVLDTIASVLATLPNDIRIEGHTDDVPIHTERFPSNWHLSVARALNTAVYIIDKYHMKPGQLSIAGYAEYRPLVPNTNAENRAKNRRVDIVIVTNVVNGVITGKE